MARRTEELRRLWQEGQDSGPAVPADMERIKAEARALLEEEQARERAA